MKSDLTPNVRLLTVSEAADYCGVSTATFNAVCPVVPIALGAGVRMRRFDVRALDSWIDSLSVTTVPAPKNWIDAIS